MMQRKMTEAEKLLFEENRKLIYSVVNRMGIPDGYGISRDDLEQAAGIGLCRACMSYDKDKGTAFSTYAVTAIRNAALDELRKAARVNGSEVSASVIYTDSEDPDDDNAELEELASGESCESAALLKISLSAEVKRLRKGSFLERTGMRILGEMQDGETMDAVFRRLGIGKSFGYRCVRHVRDAIKNSIEGL